MACRKLVAGNTDPQRKRSGGLRTKQAGRGSCRAGKCMLSGFDNCYPFVFFSSCTLLFFYLVGEKKK
ncbi:hypothetical protein CR513_33249, partial [Mucuna pruriens]